MRRWSARPLSTPPSTPFCNSYPTRSSPLRVLRMRGSRAASPPGPRVSFLRHTRGGGNGGGGAADQCERTAGLYLSSGSVRHDRLDAGVVNEDVDRSELVQTLSIIGLTSARLATSP